MCSALPETGPLKADFPKRPFLQGGAYWHAPGVKTCCGHMVALSALRMCSMKFDAQGRSEGKYLLVCS